MHRRLTRRAAARGFTLIEILVVLLIIGLLVGLVGQNVFGSLVRGQRGTAEIQIRNFDAVLKQYHLYNNRYPDSLDQLLEPDPETGQAYIDSIPLDPWENEYDYEPTNDGGYILRSFGADGAPGGEGVNADIPADE